MINIQDIIPFMKEGWVAMDKNGEWWWYPVEPYMTSYDWLFRNDDSYKDAVPISTLFDIAPVDDWEKSLMRVEGNKK